MSGEARSVSVEELLGHAQWLRRLAVNLAGDETCADDVMQDAWVAALGDRVPVQADRALPWLRGAIRKLAARTHRDRFRRARRERLVARSERLLQPDSLVERAELQQRIASAVLELGEPYRETVLLRFYEDLTPAEIASRLGIPVATVWTRLSRALERLRGGLDRAYRGDRQAWCGVILPWAFPDDATIGTVTSTTTSSASLAAGGGTAGSSAPAALALGGIIMAKKSFVASIAVGVLCAGLGIGAGRLLFGGDSRAAKDAPAMVARAELDRVDGERAQLATQLAALEAAIRELKETNDSLAKLLDEKRGEVEKLQAALAPATTETAESSLAISFGDWGALKELQEAKWPELAAAIRAMDADLVGVMQAAASGKEPEPGAMIRVQNENAKLAAYAISLIGKLPSHVQGNGAYTHPVSLSNLVSAYLDLEEVPFDDAQRERIAALGEEYEADWKRVNGEYGDETYAMQKLLDELELKRDFTKRMNSLLDAEQHARIDKPDVRDRVYVDTLSPALNLTMATAPVAVKSKEELRGALAKAVAQQYGLDEASVARSRALDGWIEEVDPLLAPVPESVVQIYTLDEALAAGRAQLRALQALTDELALPDEKRALLMSGRFVLVPRVVVVPPANP